MSLSAPSTRRLLAAILIPMAGVGGCAVEPIGGPAAPPAVYVPPRGVEKYVQGVQAQKSGNIDQAIVSLTEATSINPELTMARSMLGDLYKEKGQFESAAHEFEAVTKLDPYTGRNFYKLGVVYHLLARLQEAIGAYMQAMKLDPRDWESSMNLGLVHLALGEKDEAIADLTRATILNPGAAAAFSNLGVALDSVGKHVEAEAAYRRALELAPDDSPALSNLAANLMTQKKYRDATIVLTHLLEVSDTPSNHKRRGDALALVGRSDEAATEYRAALEKEPENYQALNGLGAALIAKYRQGFQLDEKARSAAVEAWEKSLTVRPGQTRVDDLIKRWKK